jgi:hypothetical protein
MVGREGALCRSERVRALKASNSRCKVAAWTSVSNPERLFHEAWLGMVQPEGLVVSPPVLVRAQCHERHPKSVQLRLVELCSSEPGKPLALRSLPELLEQLLGLTPDLFDAGAALPAALALYVSEERHRQLVAWIRLPVAAPGNIVAAGLQVSSRAAPNAGVEQQLHAVLGSITNGSMRS